MNALYTVSLAATPGNGGRTAQHLGCATGVPSKLKNGDMIQFGTDSQVTIEVRVAKAPCMLLPCACDTVVLLL